MTGSEAISTVDLTGAPDGSGGTLRCVAVPVDELSHYGTKALQLLERFGIDVFEALG